MAWRQRGSRPLGDAPQHVAVQIWRRYFAPPVLKCFGPFDAQSVAELANDVAEY